MKTINKAVCISCIFTYSLLAELGCMDNSYHLANLDDPKKMYVVTGADGGPCSCPCSRYCAQYKCSLRHGQCPVCKHYRVPRPLTIIRKQDISHEVQPVSVTDTYKLDLFRKKIATQIAR